MVCKKCNNTILEDEAFCPYCGEKVVKEEVETNVEPEKKPAKCWSVFAKVAKILGIVSLATSWIPLLLGVSAGIPGIVFACLGNKAKDEVSKANRKKGLTFSIIGTIISFVTYFALIIIAALLAENYA